MDTVTIVDVRGNAITAEGISFINVLSNNKNYIFYTLNEIVENDLVKMYVAETAGTPNVAQAIPDNDWNNIRNIMMRITRGEDVQEIKYLPFTSANSIYIGEPKKLAIKEDKEQIFKTNQVNATMHQQMTAQTNYTPSGNNTFFDPNVASPQTEEPAFVPQSEQNIFANPMQPTFPTQPEPQVVETNVGQAPVMNPQVIQTTPNPQIIQTVPMDTINNPGVVAENTMPASQIPVQENIMSEQQIIGQPQENVPEQNLNNVENTVSTPVITEEQAIEALRTLNTYFGLTATLPSELAEKANAQNAQVASEVVSTEVLTSPEVANTETLMIDQNTSFIDTTPQPNYSENNMQYVDQVVNQEPINYQSQQPQMMNMTPNNYQNYVETNDMTQNVTYSQDGLVYNTTEVSPDTNQYRAYDAKGVLEGDTIEREVPPAVVLPDNLLANETMPNPTMPNGMYTPNQLPPQGTQQMNMM